ncbi:MAG: amidohydrolase family protein, partial [Myxococcota bacterium]
MHAPFAIENVRIVTPRGPARGPAMDELLVVEEGRLLIADGRVTSMGRSLELPAVERIDGGGGVLLPAFVDCHTHACWAGDRLDEWQAKLQGASYLEIAAQGGGILSTVGAVRAASEDELASLLDGRLAAMERHGTASVEVKSGYGLTPESELKMLRAIRTAGTRWTGSVSITACIGHAIVGDESTFVEETLQETLAAVTVAFPGAAIDAYCEKGAWSVADTSRLVRAAHRAGHRVRLHVDQFHELGMLEVAIAEGVRSVDHLEATGIEGLTRLGA